MYIQTMQETGECGRCVTAGWDQRAAPRSPERLGGSKSFKNWLLLLLPTLFWENDCLTFCCRNQQHQLIIRVCRISRQCKSFGEVNSWFKNVSSVQSFRCLNFHFSLSSQRKLYPGNYFCLCYYSLQIWRWDQDPRGLSDVGGDYWGRGARKSEHTASEVSGIYQSKANAHLLSKLVDRNH